MEVGGGDAWDLSDQGGLGKDIVVRHDISVLSGGLDK